MEKGKNSSAWTEAGYTIFAEEGMAGIQVERLARMLNLNKSGFYHYFGDVDGFCDELISLHKEKAKLFLADVATVKSIDPDYLMVCVKHKKEVMVHLQLLRHQGNPLFSATAEKIDQEENFLLCDHWTHYLGIHDNPSLAMRYFKLVRDMLYARISVKHLEYPFLHKSMMEAKAVMQQMMEAGHVKADHRLLKSL
ncbi:MAG TPA: TetR/AcrR family transcriptional regulator [Chryseolinea sp.]